MSEIPDYAALYFGRKKPEPPRTRPPLPPDQPVATIGQLMRCHPGWCWAYCLGGASSNPCFNERAITFAQFAILWGLNASSDMIRERLVCTECGRKGAQLIMPSRDGLGFPMDFPG